MAVYLRNSQKFSPAKLFHYTVCSVLLILSCKSQEVPCGPQDLWDYTFADWEVLHFLLSVSTGSIIWRTYSIAHALYICVKRMYRESLAKQWRSSCHSVWHVLVSLTVVSLLTLYAHADTLWAWPKSCGGWGRTWWHCSGCACGRDSKGCCPIPELGSNCK